MAKKYMEEPLRVYLDEAASGLSTPGGGSVSALAGALGATMASMVANFTVGKEKFRAVEEEVNGILKTAEETRAHLGELAQKDTEVYAEVSRAYKLPRKTEEEKKKRSAGIQDALRLALTVPEEAVEECWGLLRLTPRLAEIGNPNLLSDVGVAAILLQGALEGAAVNVEVNLAGIRDEAFVKRKRGMLNQRRKEAAELREKLCGEIEARLRG